MRRILLGGLALALAAPLLAACADGPNVDDEPRLELGTGTWRFEPIEDGEEVPLVRGAQGGWHVWISLRSENLPAVASGSLELSFQPADESRPPQRTTVGVRFDPPDSQGRRAYLGWPAILPDPACAVGETYRFEAVVITAAGQRLTAERDLVIGPGLNPPPECVVGAL